MGSDLCSGLFIVLLVGAAVTLIGHGLWVFFAKMFGQQGRFSPGIDPGALPSCPRCDATLRRIPCARCGWGTTATSDELVITLTQVQHLRDGGFLDQATCDAVAGAIRAKRHQEAAARVVAKPVHVEPVIERPAVVLSENDLVSEATPAVRPSPAPTHLHEAPVARIPVPTSAPMPAPMHAPVAHREPPPPPPPLAPPRKPLSDVLASFMEQRNIRWGELIGGLLIVGCSVALVVSLWSQIADRPLIKFFVFTAVTAGIFGVGLYTEHRWKLPLTSRGLLVIASLLVPLNFLASAAFSASESFGDPITIVSQVVSLVLFFWLMWMGAKVIAPQWPLLLTGVVMSLCVTLPGIRYLAPRDSAMELSMLHRLALAAMPVGLYLAATMTMWDKARRRWSSSLTMVDAHAVLRFLGVVSFAAVLPLGLVIYKAGATLGTFRTLSPLISLAGMPALAAGLLLWNKLADDATLVGTRTAGTSIALVGALILAAGAILAFPMPATMVPVGLIAFAVLATVAVIYEIPALHLLAGCCLSASWLAAFHALSHHLAWDQANYQAAWEVGISVSTAWAATVLFVVIVVACELLLRYARAADAAYYGITAALLGAMSLSMAARQSFFGQAGGGGLAWIFAIYAAAVIAAAVLLRWDNLAYGGFALLLMALRQWTGTWSMAFLCDATLATVVVVALGRIKWREGLTRCATWSAVAGSVACAVLLLGDLSLATNGALAPRFLWLSVIALALALARSGGTPMFFSFQAVSLFSLLLAIVGRLNGHDWFTNAPAPLFHPWSVQILTSACGAVALIWALVRWLAKGQTRLKRLLEPAWSFDRILTGAVMATFVVLTLWAAFPGIASEFELSTLRRAVHSQPAGPHLLATGYGSWIVLGLLLVLWIVEIARAGTAGGLFAMVVLLFGVCLLGAARWEDQNAVASSLRWYLSAYVLVISTAIWIWAGSALRDKWTGTLPALRAVLLLLTVIPILSLTLHPSVQALAGQNIIGPAAGCFFSRIGNPLSYLVPLIVVIGVFVGYAMGERSSGFAFMAALVLNLAVTLGYALANISVGLAGPRMVRLIQLNAIASSVFALGWMAILRLRKHLAQNPNLLHAQVGIGTVLAGVLVLGGELRIFLMPHFGGAVAGAIGHPLGWLALLLALAAAIWLWRLWELGRGAMPAICISLLAIAPMPAFTCYTMDLAPWTAYHALLSAHALAAWIMLALAWLVLRHQSYQAESSPVSSSVIAPAASVDSDTGAGAVAGLGVLSYQRPQQAHDALAPLQLFHHRRATNAIWLFLWLTVLIALRGSFSDPMRPWWSSGAIFAMAMLAVTTASWQILRRYLYPAALLLNLAATIWWSSQYWQWGTRSLLDAININIIALAIPAIAWLVLELQVFRKARPQAQPQDFRPIHQPACILAAFAICAVTAVAFAGQLINQHLLFTPSIGWAALASVLALMIGCLWDEESIQPIAGCYCLGLTAVAFTLDQYRVPVDDLLWLGAIVLGAYALITSSLFHLRSRLALLVTKLGIPPRSTNGAGNTSLWLIPANLILVALVLIGAYASDFVYPDAYRRLLVAAMALGQAIGLALLATGEDLRTNRSLRQIALWTAVVGVIALVWAPLNPQSDSFNRLVLVMIALSAMTILYGVGLAKLFGVGSAWAAAARRSLPALMFMTIASLGIILADEIVRQVQWGQLNINPWCVAAVGAALIALAVGSLTMALVPGQRDPLHLPERFRTAYVYAAEVLLGLVFVHLRMSHPEWFGGIFARYWPFVVMAIAFGGVGLSEIFRRQNRMVLAEPLERTGAFLPLLPALGFWAMHSQVDYSSLLIVVGLLYVILAVMRRSFFFGLCAAVAGNGSLWYFLHHLEGFGLLTHPQLWLIPAALSVLAAAYLNRNQLSEKQTQTIRFMCLMLIYVSSTADMFINGVAKAPWLPVVLAGLSIAGVLTGIALRVRSFLFLGTAFLTLSLISIIYHASVDLRQTWLIWVAGIALGLAILLLFAVFEKKRTQVLAMLDRFKQWEA